MKKIPAKPRNKKLIKSGSGGSFSSSINQVISNIQGSSHEHPNKNVLDRITETALNGALRELITSTDETPLTDENILSSLRVLSEILKNNATFLEDLKEVFLSKVNPDTAQKLIKFVEGIEVGTFSSGFLGSGAALKMNNGISELEVDKLTVRMVATFFELVISRLTHIGGQIVLSPARMKCNKVVDGGTYYKCYFDTGDGEVSNEFVAGDQARCQVFTGSGTKFYWRLVTSVGTDWINLSKTDAVSGSDAPEAGDDISQLGNRTDTDRQNAQILSTVGADAPSWKQYKGINSFSLGEEKILTKFTRLGNKIDGKTVFMSSGANVEDGINSKNSNYSSQPTSYKANDTWTLSADTTVNGIAYKSGEILTATQDSTTFVQAHWVKRVRYTDDAAVNNLQVNSRNYVRNSRLDNLTGWSTIDGTRSIVNDAKFGNVVQWARTSGTPGNYQKEFTIVEKSSFNNAPLLLFVIAKRISETGSFNFGWVGNGSFVSTTAGTTNQIDLGDGWTAFWRAGTGSATFTGASNFGINTLTGNWQFYAVGLNMANKYSGWQLADEDIKADIDSAKLAAETAAKSYADTKAEAERVLAEAYADGIVSDEEQARIDDVNAKLAAAKAYAEAQDALLKTQQEAYADGKASAAELAAIAAAEAYADLKKTESQAYADGKVSAEEARAIADATAKFNEAKTHADTLVNNLQIGGRNLFSINNFVADNKARGYSTISVIEHEGNIAYRSTNISLNHNIPRYLQGKFEANTQYYFKFNILWESFTNSAAQYTFTIRYTDGTTSTLSASTVQTYRALLTSANKTIDYITTTRQYSGNVVIYNIQLEKANKPSDWTPAIEDVKFDINKAQADANLARATTDKFSGFDGGLATAVIMEMREPSTTTRGDATAFISGMQGTLKNLPAFGAGGTYADAIAGLAKIIFRHDGTGKIGVFEVDAAGSVKIFDPDIPSLLRLKFIKSKLPPVADLLASTGGSGSTTNVATTRTTTGSTTLTNSVEITVNGSDLTFTGNLILNASQISSGITGIASVTVYLYKDGVLYAPLGSISSPLIRDEVPAFSESLAINETLVVPSGTYTIVVSANINNVTATAGINNTSTIAWELKKDIKEFIFGSDGFTAWYTNNHLHVTEDGGVDGRAPADKWNVPGVLLSATVALAGGFSNWWGAKKHASNTAVKVASTSGTYDIYHSIGHTNYQVSLTPHSNRTFYVGVKDIDKVRVYFYTNAATPALSDTNFDVQITGNNY